jgi:pimeloyl-ACP methyl ester carboxylesterase
VYLNRIQLHGFAISTAILGTVFSFSTSLASSVRCDMILKALNGHDGYVEQTYYVRNRPAPETNYFNFPKFLAEKIRKESAGVVETKYSQKYQTNFYSTATSPEIDPSALFTVDPDSNAMFLGFPGNGTTLSSGKNFIGIMNSLAKLGFSAASFDYPFHMSGPHHQPKFNDVNHFMAWIHQIVLEAKKSGKPVYLFGHSFGPDVIAEYITRYPNTVDGVLLISPAGFTPELAKWYDEHTSKMKFGGQDVVENAAGAEWGALMSDQFVWSKHKLPDPTVVNPALKVHLLSGNREEYVPAPVGGANGLPIGPNTYDIGAAIKQFFSTADPVIVDGVGHYIFEARDENKSNIVMRELLRLAGADIKDSVALTDKASMNIVKRGFTDKVRTRYSYDRNFRSFVDHYVGPTFAKKMINENETFARTLNDQYEIYAKAYETKITEFALSSIPELSEFQKSNPELIAAARKNPREQSSSVLAVFSAYLDVLDKQDATLGREENRSEKILSLFHYDFPAQLVNFKK